jgi:hypothetical protein
MILYNITINVSAEIEQDFITWMKETHIPEIMQTGIFYEFKFLRLMHDSDDGSVNYATQYFTDTIDQMMDYERNHAPAIRAKTQARYQDKAIAFRTLLETV